MLSQLPRPCKASTRRLATAGFSLVELIVVVVLVGILMAVGLPAFTLWISNTQVRTVAEALQNGIRMAQTEAVRRNRQVVLSFTNSVPALNATAVSGGKNWAIQTVPSFGETAEFAQGGSMADVASAVTLASTPASTALCFNSNGRLALNASPGVPGASCAAAATSFTVSHAAADRSLNVTVSISGKVRMCDPKRPAQSSTSPDGC